MKTFPVLLAFILVALGFESRAAAPAPTNTLITTNIPITTNVTGGYFLVHVPVSGSSLGLRQASLAVVSAAVGGSGVSLATVTNIVVGITTPQSNALRTLTLQVGLANANYTTAVSNSLYSLAYALAASGTNNVTSLSNAIIAYVNANSSITNAVGGAGQYQLLLGNKLRRLEFTGDATVTTNGDLISVDVTAGSGASNSINGAQATNIFVGLATASNWATVTYAQSLTNPMATTAFVNSALASYTPLTLATNLRTLVVLTSSGATSIATNSGQITLTINTNVSGGGVISGSDATNIFTGLAIASNWLATSTFNTSTSAIVGLIDSRSDALSNYTASAFLTNANNVQQRLITNQSVKTFSAGSNMTITDQGTNLVLAASLSGGAASLSDVTNIVEELSVLQNSGNGTNTTLVNPTIIGGPLTNSLRSLRQYRMIVDGDSQTDDAGLPGYANWVQQLVWTNSSTNIFAPFNAAKSGSTVASLLSEDRAGRLRRLATNEAGIYLQAIGINSLLADLDAVTIAGQLTNSWRRYKTNGWKVVAFTPFGTNTLSAAQHTNLINLCTIIRNSSAEYDYLVDAVTNTAITLSDNLHPTVAGSTALMQQVKQTIEPEYLIGLPQQAGATVGKQIFSAKQANDFAAEFTEGSSLRFKVPGSNPFQGVYWAGTYGDSLRATAESTNGMDSILFWAYARKVMRILGDPSGVLGDRVAIGVNAVTNQNFLTNGYRLYVSGHGYFEDITANSGITGILRGESGSFLTNSTSFNNFKIANSGFLLFGYGSSNHVATGISSNNNYGISVPDNSYVLKTAPGVNYYVGIGSSVWGFLTNGTLVWPDGTISSNSMPTNVTSNVKFIGTTQLRGGLDASSNHWAMGISSNNNFGLDLTNNTALVLDTAPLVDVVVSADTNRWKLLSTRGTDAARIEWPNGVLESAQIHAAFSAGHIPTNYTPGNGVGGGISGGVLTTYTTNITHVLATNLTTVALHGNTVTNEYFLSEAHAAIAVNPTNFTGFTNREIILMIENSSGATRTITINTNGWGGAIRWHRFPANSGNTVNLTNNSTLELNFKLNPSGRMVVAGSLAQ